jgi:hypothetical protein
MVSGEMTSKESLSEVLVGHCLDVLRKLTPDEKDLIRIVVEIISDLRDPFVDEPEEPPVSFRALFRPFPLSDCAKPRTIPMQVLLRRLPLHLPLNLVHRPERKRMPRNGRRFK